MSGLPLVDVNDSFDDAENYQPTNFHDPAFFSVVLTHMDKENFCEAKEQFTNLPVKNHRGIVIGRVKEVVWNETDQSVVGVISIDKENYPYLFKALDKGYIKELPDAIELPGRPPDTLKITEIHPPEFPSLPIDYEITVLPADNGPRILKPGFVIKEYIGFEIYPVTEEMREWELEKLCDSRLWERDGNDSPIHHKIIDRKEDLHEGMQVMVKTLFDYHWVTATVIKGANGELQADTEGNYYVLEFGGDDRNCWVCTMCVNKNALEKVTFSN